MLRVPAIVLYYYVFFSISNILDVVGDFSFEAELKLKLEFPPNEINFSVDETPFSIVTMDSKVLNRHSQGGCVQKTLSFRIAAYIGDVDFWTEKALDPSNSVAGDEESRASLETYFPSLQPGRYLFQAYLFDAASSSAERSLMIANNTAHQFADILFKVSANFATPPPISSADPENRAAAAAATAAALPADPPSAVGGVRIYFDFPPPGHGTPSAAVVLQLARCWHAASVYCWRAAAGARLLLRAACCWRAACRAGRFVRASVARFSPQASRRAASAVRCACALSRAAPCGCPARQGAGRTKPACAPPPPLLRST
jgi:hypothetical protein